MSRRAAFLALVFCVTAASAGAQEVDFSLRPPRDSALARARALVSAGKADDGRKLVDSVLSASADDPEAMAEALFWRGVLAGTAADAERSYRRLLIEAPLSDRAEESLLQLATLEAARGDRRGATDHLYQYMLSYGPSPDRPARPRLSLWLVRLLFELPDPGTRGCQAVQMSRDAIPAASIELRNQLESYVTRCAYAEAAAPDTTSRIAADQDTTARPTADRDTTTRPTADRDTATRRTATRDTATRRTATRPTARQTASAAAPFFSVQVAAYDAREAANNLVTLLVSRGLEARVDGTRPPYRVRVGKFATRAEASRMQQSLKAQGQNGFITQVRP